MIKLKNIAFDIYNRKEKLWSAIFLLFFSLLLFWNLLFLNEAALKKWLLALVNTYLFATASTLFAFIFAKIFIDINTQNSITGNKTLRLAIGLFFDFLRSVPQVIILLAGYVLLIFFFASISIVNFILLSIILSLAFVNEAYAEMQNRIDFYKQTDFYNASIVAGIPLKTIINRDILLRNSLPYLINRAVNIFTASVFLLCSVDFIVSVGLTNEVNLASLPVTLGNILANISSKEDILAVREVFVNPFYFTELFTKHLQGISAALLLVITLITGFKVSNGIIETNNLSE